MNLESSTQLCRLLADASRLRLLSLLEAEPLTVAELTQVTGLAQSRISTHLAKLRDAGMIADRRQGSSSLYTLSIESASPALRELWGLLRHDLDDEQLAQDRERAREVIRAREPERRWADSVAGRMEAQYSPGRSWEATTRALTELVALGDVVDIASGDGVLAELLHRHARHIHCVDLSPVVVEAGRKRLAHCANVHFGLGDMHALDFPDRGFDVAFVLHALTYSREPEKVLKEAARVLRKGGRLICATLNAHEHAASVAAYDHVNLGFTPAQLNRLLKRVGLVPQHCAITSRESKPPYFEVVTAIATKP